MVSVGEYPRSPSISSYDFPQMMSPSNCLMFADVFFYILSRKSLIVKFYKRVMRL